jgi:hypothetical protein
MKNKVTQIFFCLGLIFLTSCGFSPTDPGGGMSYPSYGDASSFVDNLSADASVVDDFELKKYQTEQGGGFVIILTDFGELRGVDIYLDQRWNNFGSDLNFFDAHSFPVDPLGNNLYEDYNGNIYEETFMTSKDLERIGAMVEKVKRAKFQNYLVSRFELSESRAVEISKLLMTWKKIDKKRSITPADIKIYSEKLFGFDLSSGVRAYKLAQEGDKSEFDKLIQKAADVNLTDPEHIKDILTELMF